jgi:hypothetical protein
MDIQVDGPVLKYKKLTSAVIIIIIYYNLPFFDSVLLPPIILSSLSVRLMPFLKSITNSLEKYFERKDVIFSNSRLLVTNTNYT